MNRDVLTTIGGLVLVGVIVVATFLYGNQQRQSQLRHNQTAARQSQPAAKTPTATSSSPTATSQQPGVEKPSSNNQTTLQGGSTTQPVVPSSGSTPAETPKTGGSGVLYVIGATLIVMLYRMHRQSRLAVTRASLKTTGSR